MFCLTVWRTSQPTPSSQAYQILSTSLFIGFYLVSDLVPDLPIDLVLDLVPDLYPDLSPDLVPDFIPDLYPDLVPDLLLKRFHRLLFGL